MVGWYWIETQSDVKKEFFDHLPYRLVIIWRGGHFWHLDDRMFVKALRPITRSQWKIDEISGKGANFMLDKIIKEVRRLEEKGINLLLFMKKKLGNGLSTLFWDDVWCDGGKLKNRFPRAYALENSKQITIGQKLAHPSLYHCFSPEAWFGTLNNSGWLYVAFVKETMMIRDTTEGDLKNLGFYIIDIRIRICLTSKLELSLKLGLGNSRRGSELKLGLGTQVKYIVPKDEEGSVEDHETKDEVIQASNVETKGIKLFGVQIA
ncbi:hypothetical protein Tco_0673688 [Tanacetum coccineum]